VAEFLLECYVSRTDGRALARREERARVAAEELTREGTPIRVLRSIFVPDDETCFYLYEAETVEAVREAARRAALPSQRIAEAISDSKGATT
jgi:Protein of unknown function (DUF4242)